MMTLITILLFNLQITINNCDSLQKVRNLFQTEINKKQLDKMILICNASSCKQVIPYLAAATMKKAEFVWYPLDKLKYFKKGKKILENFIKEHPKNIEAKYIRWLTQKMAPKFLNYREHLEQDYQFILNNIANSNIDPNYKQHILANIKQLKNE